MVCIEATKESSQSGTASFKEVAETLASKVMTGIIAWCHSLFELALAFHWNSFFEG